MTNNIQLQSAFVLHSRPFRDSSLLIDLFSMRFGRISAVAHGARSSKSRIRGLLLPFVPLLASYSGKTDLVTLGKIEPAGLPLNLSGKVLLSGLYMNELLVTLLQPHDAHVNLYRAYHAALIALHCGKELQSTLRLFEKVLIAELGYGLQLNIDVDGGMVEAENCYRYEFERGFVNCDKSEAGYSGRSLLAFYQEELHDLVVLTEIKKLMREVLRGVLGGRKLKTRELFTF